MSDPAQTRALPAHGAGFAMLAGRAVPAFDLAQAPDAPWGRHPAPGGEVLLRGDAAALPALVPRRVRLALAPLAPLVAVAMATRRPATAYDLVSPGGQIRVPMASLLRVVPLPGLRAIPWAPAEVLGWAVADGAVALVIDPCGMAAGAQHLVLLLLDGRLVGLPCTRLAPTEAEPTDLSPLRALLGWAPAHAPPLVLPAPATTGLLVAQAGGQRFALAAAEVEAAIAPACPTALPAGRAAIAHRGEILPVLDAGLLLGMPPVIGQGRAMPLLRLRLAPPLALAVSAIEGLRPLGTGGVAPLATGVMVGLATWPGAAPIPLLGAARLGEALSP